MRKMQVKMQSLIAKVPTWFNYWLTGLASSTEEATRDGIRDLISNIDALKLRVQQALEEDEEKDEWDAGFEERQRRRDEKGKI